MRPVTSDEVLETYQSARQCPGDLIPYVVQCQCHSSSVITTRTFVNIKEVANAVTCAVSIRGGSEPHPNNDNEAYR